MGSLFRIAALCIVAVSAGMAEELPPEVQARFIKILANNAGCAGKVDCRNPALAEELKKLGLTMDPTSRVAWASSEAEATALQAAGKLVICGRLGTLPMGGAVAIVKEGEKPQIYLHMGNLASSHVTLSDAVLKIGKKM